MANHRTSVLSGCKRRGRTYYSAVANAFSPSHWYSSSWRTRHKECACSFWATCLLLLVCADDAIRRLELPEMQRHYFYKNAFLQRPSHSPTYTYTLESIKTITLLTFRHRASSILGQAFRYSPENAFYMFNQQIYFIIWYLLDRASLI